MTNENPKDLKRNGSKYRCKKTLTTSKLRPQPLILDHQHKNIATLMTVLVAILVGLGSGWLAGGLFVGPDNQSERAQTVAATNNKGETGPAVLDSSAQTQTDTGVEAETRSERRQDIDETESADPQEADQTLRGRRSAGGRRTVGTGARGESIPLAIIKGKPLKKALRPLRRVRFW